MTVDCGTFLQERIDAGENVMLEGAQGTSRHRPWGLPLRHLLEPDRRRRDRRHRPRPDRRRRRRGHRHRQGLSLSSRDRPAADRTRRCRGPDARLYSDAGAAADEEELATYIRDEGGEYGTVTGRPRRVGWLDMPMLRHAARANGFTGLAVNHIDVLAGLETVEVGHSYEFDTAEQSSASNQNSGSSDDGEEIFTMPPTTEQWGRCEATFKSFDGWPEVDWAAVADDGYEAIPENARTYLEYIADELDTPVYAVGVGPGREETIVVENPYE